jgi:hypothetical protein
MLCEKCGARFSNKTSCPNCGFDNAGVDFTPKEPKGAWVYLIVGRIFLVILVALASLSVIYNLGSVLISPGIWYEVLWHCLAAASSIVFLVSVLLILIKKPPKRRPLLIPVLAAALLLSSMALARTPSEQYWKLQSLHYTYGALFFGNWSYTIEPQGDAYLFTALVDILETEEITKVEKVIDQAVMDDLEKLIIQQELYRRNGENLLDDSVYDGLSEQFSADYKIGRIIYSYYGADFVINAPLSSFLFELTGLPPEFDGTRGHVSLDDE